MDLYEVTYTAKPLKRGWYAIYKNWIPLMKNKAGVGYSHPKRKRRERIMRSKNPRVAIASLEKQGSRYEEMQSIISTHHRVR